MAHQFGSDWTKIKLNCVREYAEAWSTLMRPTADKYGWQTRYIDAFSGSGSYVPKTSTRGKLGSDDLLDTDEEREELQKGSAQIAIDMQPPFDRIDLIELKSDFANDLQRIAGVDFNRRVFVHREDVNDALPRLCRTLDKRRDRALIFVDPYGCEVDWSTLEAIARSEVSDVWYLAPTSGLNRQLSEDPGKIEPYKRERLRKSLGTDDWEPLFYRKITEPDLFGPRETIMRTAGPDEVEKVLLDRLGSIFPAVYQRCLRLKNTRNGHLFSLCFAVSNPNKKAQTLAMRVAGGIIKKWEARA